MFQYMSPYINIQVYIVASRAVSKQRLRKIFPAATDTHETLELLLERGFPTVVRAEEL
jgi:hypothetical protein